MHPMSKKEKKPEDVTPEEQTEQAVPTEETEAEAPNPLLEELEALKKSLSDQEDKFLRLAAEYDNSRRRSRTVVTTINNIPLTNADIITGVSMMLFFVLAVNVFNGTLGAALGIKWNLGFVTLLIAHLTFDIPHVILCVMPKLQQLDPNIYEAAQDLGAPGFLAFRKVILPEIMPGVINGLLIAFTMSIDDFVISYFTAGSTFSTLSMVIYSMAKKRVSPEINALSTLLFVVVVTLLVIVNVRQTRQDKRRMVHGN